MGRFAMCRDGKAFAVPESSGDGLRLIDGTTGKPVRALFFSDKLQYGATVSFDLSPDGKMLAANSPRAICVWDTATGKTIAAITLGKTNLGSLSFSANGNYLAAGSKLRNQNLVAYVFETATGKQVAALKLPHKQAVRPVLSPDGKLLATPDEDATVQLWEVATGKELRRLRLQGKGLSQGLAFARTASRWRRRWGPAWSGSSTSPRASIAAGLPADRDWRGAGLLTRRSAPHGRLC